MNRREFIGSAGAFALGGCVAGRGAERTYSVSILGDTHYDVAPARRYHAAYIREFAGKKENQWGFREFPRNSRMWEDVCLRTLLASGRAVRPDCAFVYQAGDLVQGDCNDPAVHAAMLRETLAFMKAAYPRRLPFVTVCGNHDVRGGVRPEVQAGTRRAYADTVCPFVAAELGARLCGPIAGTTFAFRQGPDLFVAVDFNGGDRSVPELKRLLGENPDARYTFILIHGGIFPYDFWSRYFYLGDPKLDGVRREVRSLLARRNAIVLSGHTHHLELKEAVFPEGTIVEATVNTVDDGGTPAVPRRVREGVETYGKDAAFLDRIVRGRELFAEYRPFMTRRYDADALGHAILRVSDGGVELDYFGHDAETPTKTFVLRQSRSIA